MNSIKQVWKVQSRLTKRVRNQQIDNSNNNWKTVGTFDSEEDALKSYETHLNKGELTKRIRLTCDGKVIKTDLPTFIFKQPRKHHKIEKL